MALSAVNALLETLSPAALTRMADSGAVRLSPQASRSGAEARNACGSWRSIPANHFEQMEAIRSLARQTAAQLELRRKLAELEEARRQIEAERAESERLLLNVLPRKIAQELRRNGCVRPRYHPSATVLFADFSGFTMLAENSGPGQLILCLHFSVRPDRAAWPREAEEHR